MTNLAFNVLAFFAVGLVCANGNSLDANLVYRSPLVDHPDLALKTKEIHARHARAYAKRQLSSSDGLHVDEQYPSFYGSDFTNAPFVWNGGVNFTHSVASGDPFDTSVLLWTRAFPIASTTPSNPSTTPLLPDQSVPVCVEYDVATDEAMRHVVRSGRAYTTYDVDFTVKVEANHLQADTRYFYQFADCTNKANASPVGRTRTFAHADTPASRVNGGKPLKFAVFSCSQFQVGYFNAYGVAHNTTPDLMIHLGDYIYESIGSGARIGRAVLGRELATLKDYRQRYNQYRTDTSLSEAHQFHPWVTVWDDHEVANNGWKAGTSDSNDTAAGCVYSPAGTCFTDRKLSAIRAYHEWLPVRQVDPDDKLRIWRNFQIGKLVDLTMLDTRNYDRDVTSLGYNQVIDSLRAQPQRSLMGAKQEQWLNDTLSASKNRGAVWRIIGQQIVFTQVNSSNSLGSGDAWNGYLANRARILQHLYNNSISNTAILSGDSHKNWVSDLAFPNDTTTYDPVTGTGAIGVEFAGTAVTSDAATTGAGAGRASTPAAADAASQKAVNNKGSECLKWNEGSYRGFFTLTISPKEMVAEYYAMQNVSFPNLDSFVSATFHVAAGANKLSRPIAGGTVLAGALQSVPPTP